MILPQFSVANFEIEECNKLPVDVSWTLTDGSTKTKCLFGEKNNFPSVKSMTFDGRKEPMDVAVAYANPELALAGIPTMLSRYHIEPPVPKHEKFALKLRVKLDHNSIPGLDTAEMVEEFMEEKKIPLKMAKNPPPKKEEPKKEDTKEGEEPKDAEMKDDKPAEKVPEPEQQYETKMVNKTTTT
jgi:hypothetical protein